MEKRKQNWRLRQARERRSWTQREVADQIDLLDVRNLRRWEAGDTSPSLRYRARLCELFAMNAEELGLLPNIDSLFLLQEDHISLKHSQPATTEYYPSSTLPTNQSVMSRETWNRQQILKKVYAFWIHGLLKPYLGNTPYLKLNLFECPDMVTPPWSQVVRQPDRPTQPLSPDKHISQIYDDACGELLILGEQGTGKTTLLLELTRDLLKRASQNEAHPIPIIFHLSSWSAKQQPLTTWFIEELNNKYQVPQQVGHMWVQNDHILPLLDGLNEVNPAFRKVCMNEIKQYRKHHGLVPLVLCSRTQEYLDLGEQIQLLQAISIQPACPQLHIKEYI